MKPEDIREEGNKFAEKGDFKLAIKSFQKVIDIDPKNFKVWADLGSVYGKIGKKEKELECYNKCYELEKKYMRECLLSGDAHYFLQCGDMFFNDGDYDKAKEYYEKSLEIDPTNKYLHNQFKIIDKLKKK